MKVLLTILLPMITATVTIFDFDKASDIKKWRIVDDVVMGGRSDGHFMISKEGYGVFYGSVSLENNGGFSSVRYDPGVLNCSDQKFFRLRLKGDGKKYQFRVKSDKWDRHSYIYEFTTSGDWEDIRVPFDEMYPAFRGRMLNIPNFSGEQAVEIAFLIGNKKPQDFRLLIDEITME